MKNKTHGVLFKLKGIKSLFLLLILFSFCLMQVTAGTNSPSQQQIVVKGIVVDKETGESVPGVNIKVEGAKVGTVTDMNGNFTIKVPSEKTVLNFSYISYTTQKVTVGNQTNYKIALEPDVKGMQEVVVIGYGSQKKINLTDVKL